MELSIPTSKEFLAWEDRCRDIQLFVVYSNTLISGETCIFKQLVVK